MVAPGIERRHHGTLVGRFAELYATLYVCIEGSYPPLAKRNKAESTIILTTLIDESGNVADVKVLRGDDRFGFNEAAIRAIRATRFSQPTKNGRRVKTWRPQMIVFKL